MGLAPNFLSLQTGRAMMGQANGNRVETWELNGMTRLIRRVIPRDDCHRV